MYELFSEKEKIKKATKTQNFFKVLYNIANYLLDIIGIGLGVAFGLILFDILEKYLK